MKYLYTLIVFMFLFSNCIELFSQKHFNNWYFGFHAGLTFNTKSGEPVPLKDGVMETIEGCSTISDSSGGLLFCTNGVTVWNRLNNVMTNGTNLFGHISSTQSALIAHKPKSDCIYYIFTVYADIFNDNLRPVSKGFNYSIVDLSLENGYGAVTKKNIHLLDTTTERLAGVIHKNGEDIWIVTQDLKEKCFMSYLLTKDSLCTKPVKSVSNINYSLIQLGMIKFSPDGNKLALTFQSENKVYLYNFDRATGQMSDEIYFELPNCHIYGIEFSPNNKFIYVGSYLNKNYLYQFDVSAHDSATIKNSQILIRDENNSEGYYGLQLGPNNKIYVSGNSYYLSVIHKPDQSGLACDFKQNDILFQNGTCRLGLPSVIQDYKPINDGCKIDNIMVCEGLSISLFAPYYDNSEYTWTGPKGFTSNIRNPSIINSKVEMTGNYYYKIKRDGIQIYDGSINVTVNPRDTIIFSEPRYFTVCADSVELIPVKNPEGFTFSWKEINSTSNKVTIKSSGYYTIYVTNKFGCLDSATYNVTLSKPAKAKIISEDGTSMCPGSIIHLYSKDVNYYYHWSTGQDIKAIKITKGGKYYLTVKTQEGCSAVDSIIITELEKPDVEFEKSVYVICSGDSVILRPVKVLQNYQYTWSDGFTGGLERVIKENKNLYLIAKSQNGCTDTAFVKIAMFDNPKAEIIADKTEACFGEKIKLSAKDYNPLLNYFWSNGKTGESITVSESGTYKLIVKVGKFCSDTTEISVIIHTELKIVEFEKSTYVICTGDSLILKPLIIYPDYDYIWSDGFIGAQRVIKENSDLFLIVKTHFGCSDTANVKIGVFDAPVADIIADKTEACNGEKISLTAKNYNPLLNYFWSNGQNGEGITVSQSGTYRLIVSVGSFCSDTAVINVTIYPDLKLELLSDSKNLCFWDSIKIFTKLKYAEYKWSTGETTDTIVVHQPGNYQLIVKNSIGCSDTANIQIEDIKILKAKIIADKSEACYGEKITLKAANYDPQLQYLWSNSENGEEITVTQSGIYKLIVSNGNNCSDTTQIEVNIHPDLALELKTDKNVLCFNDSTLIYTKLKYDKYLWSTGETTESIYVNESGIFQLIVQNKYGCTDTSQIKILKYDAELVSDTENLIFNELCIGSAETKDIIFKLKSENDFVINNIYFKSNMFNINNSNGYLKSYNDGETIDLPVTFKPSDAGEFTDTLVIESGEPCYYKKSILLHGSSKAMFLFSLPNIVTTAGDYLIIPINAGMTCLNSDKLNSDYEMEISFDKEYFAPDSVKYGSIIENKISNQNRVIKIKSITEFKEKIDSLFQINYIYGMSLMGRKEIIPLTIDYVNFTNSRYYPEYINGSLKIENCLNNISTIQMFIPTKLSIAPNPTDGDIKMSIGTQEKGSFKIEIYDIQGQSIYSKEFIKSDSKYEEFEYYYDTKELGSGVYSIHLTSPWNILRQQLVISK